jgi:glycosyltransferase involved in cell wall biosynthesis
LVTVLMAVYNVAPYVRESIDSILNQTFADFEFLIYNDGSKDDTAAVINTYTDPRIVFVDSKVNRSVSPNLNEGLARAKGRYIVRMDGDDIAYPERIARQVAFMEAHPEIGLCGSAVRYIGASNTVVQPPETDAFIQQTLWFQNAFFQPSVIIRASVLHANNLQYNTDYELAEDYKLWSDMSFVTKLHNLSEVLLDYRIHPHQISRRRSLGQQKISLQIRREQMQRWHIELSAQQQAVFELLTNSETWSDLTLANYRQLVALLDDLLAIARQVGIDPHVVQQLLSTQWTQLLGAAPRYYLALVPIILRQPWSRHRSARANAALLAKCVLRWQVAAK